MFSKAGYSAKATTGKPMKLFLEGHAPKLGYAISRKWNDAECSNLSLDDSKIAPVRYIKSRERAQRFVSRWNRLFATYHDSAEALEAETSHAIRHGFVTSFHFRRGRAVGATFKGGQLIVECNEQAYTLDYRF
jgi:hypothetical protein